MSKQHKKPCADCPWRRNAVKGWLGDQSAKEWIRDVHGEALIQCHVHTQHDQQCAGAAIYRANVHKVTRRKECLRLPPDKDGVFGSADEFRNYHEEEEGEQ